MTVRLRLLGQLVSGRRVDKMAARLDRRRVSAARRVSAGGASRTAAQLVTSGGAISAPPDETFTESARVVCCYELRRGLKHTVCFNPRRSS